MGKKLAVEDFPFPHADWIVLAEVLYFSFDVVQETAVGSVVVLTYSAVGQPVSEKLVALAVAAFVVV